jgi:hypothetical protein
MAGSANIADLRVTLDNTDLTDRIRPRLVSLTLTEKRGGEADQLDIVIGDTDGRVALPREGARLQVQLGWRQGGDVTVGLVDKGSFVVDEVGHGGPPDVITIRARSADMTGDLRRRRDGSWHDTRLGAVLGQVAGRQGLTLRCAPALANVPVKTLAQQRESDMALVKRLGREHDAVATFKAGTLIFAPIGAAATPTGKPLAPLAIARREGDTHDFRREKREEAEGVTASWHDRAAAKKKTVTAGKKDGAKRLPRTYASEAEAQRAAKAAAGRARREPLSLSLSLALGQPDLFPERATRVSGFKAEIDAVSWIVAEVTHSFAGEGLRTSVKLETA